MPNNHYMVLGLERGADLPQIKRAYRRAIKRYHPDRGGSATDPAKFMRAQEAYEVLSDLERRRAYDAELCREGIPVHLTDTRPAARIRGSVWRTLREPAFPLEALFEGLLNDFTIRRRGPSPLERDIFLEVVLTPEEARCGGTYPVAVPVWQTCPVCGGRGAFCPACRDRGGRRVRREFDLVMPPGVADGTSAAVALDPVGLPGLRIRIDVRVRAH